MLNKDFKEFVELLASEKAEFLVVGGYALAAYGYPRYTGDLDIWLRPSIDNAKRVIAALDRFGFAGLGISLEDLTRPGSVIQLGYPPRRIDLLASIDGVEFDDCIARREVFVLDGVAVPFIGLADFKTNKRAAGRAKDLADLESLDDPDSR
ncbi:MAG: hypothetical protein JNM79_13840 [Burkholderiales bacterium]|nr:hypothetical protein [Burkholderiales bacterium]